MGVIEPNRQPGRAYFGCGGAACLGVIFWAIITCCLVVIVVGLATELNIGNPELTSAFYAISQIMAGAMAFCFSMAAILVVFVGFGIFRKSRWFKPLRMPHDLNTVLIFFFLFVGAMILAAALPVLALEFPGTNGWSIAAGIFMGGTFLLFGILMLWLSLAAYESYRNSSF